MHGNRPGDRLLELAAERRRIDGLVRALRTQTPQQRHEAGGVEGVGRALARGSAQAHQLDVGEVEAVHGHHLRGVAESVEQGLRERRLARAGRTDEAEHAAPAGGQQGVDARVELWRQRVDHGAHCRACAAAVRMPP